MTSSDAPGPEGSFLVLRGSIGRTDLPRLCERASALLEGSDLDVVVCDLEALLDPDAVTVDALARLQLVARRLGRRIRFRNACGEIHRLTALMGLDDVLPLGGSRLEPRGEAEEREQRRGVEEEHDPGDPVS
jgi:ABC-type transporter Mla MlaB component